MQIGTLILILSVLGGALYSYLGRRRHGVTRDVDLGELDALEHDTSPEIADLTDSLGDID